MLKPSNPKTPNAVLRRGSTGPRISLKEARQILEGPVASSVRMCLTESPDVSGGVFSALYYTVMTGDQADRLYIDLAWAFDRLYRELHRLAGLPVPPPDRSRWVAPK